MPDPHAPILLAGGAEFGGRMAEADRRAIELAGGPGAPIRIIPAAAAPDANHIRAGQNGVRWFRSLGARDVAAVPLTDAASAADPAVVAELRAAALIYLLGGFPGHLASALAGTPAWSAALEAHSRGAVIAGSSAGAMVLCEQLYDPYTRELREGLGLVPGVCVLPHHNGFGARWAPGLRERLPEMTLLGLDEGAAVIGGAGGWRAYGGPATLYRPGAAAERVEAGAALTLP
jgi:cyanophycinase